MSGCDLALGVLFALLFVVVVAAAVCRGILCARKRDAEDDTQLMEAAASEILARLVRSDPWVCAKAHALREELQYLGRSGIGATLRRRREIQLALLDSALDKP